MRKDIKAPNSYFTGNIGELSTNLIYQRNHIVCTSLGKSDFGEDLFCDIFSGSKNCNTYVRTQFSFRTQVKSTVEFEKEGYIRRTKKGLSVSLSTGLLKLWKHSYYPVVLIVWECSKNIGYWCFPTEETDIEKPENDTVSVSVKYTHVFDDEGVQRIKSQVESYYLTKVYKIHNSKYKCNIYPIWMPQYRIFTSMEIYNNFPIRESGNMKAISSLPNMLPAYLASYHHCELGGYITGVEYIADAQPMEQFWDGIYEVIIQVKSELQNNGWIAFIMSPVEIISELDERRISNLTEWTSFSRIENSIITDYHFTFDLDESYIYSEKVRSWSDEQELFVHDSVDFAVEIFSAGFSFYTRKTDIELVSAMRNKSFCIIDISQCSIKEVELIAEWCRERDYRFVELSNDKNKIAITHKLFDITNVGTFLPGVVTWKDWDELEFETEEFLEQVPFGNPLEPKEKEMIFDKYLQKEKYFDLSSLQYSQTLNGEALNHGNRNIKFVTYVVTFDEEECGIYFEEVRKKLKEKLNYFELYYEIYEDMSNIILEICPEIHQSTKRVVSLVEKIYHELVVNIRKHSSRQENMGYYIKYCLDRWIPEKLVGKR